MYINNLITGTMTLGSGGSTPSGHSDTRVTYTTLSGHSDWSGEIEGELTHESIPDIENTETVDIGNTVTKIGEYAFRLCGGLKTIIIPSSVSFIDYKAFEFCSYLESAVFYGKTLEQVQNIEDGYENKYYPWGIENTSIISVA